MLLGIHTVREAVAKLGRLYVRFETPSRCLCTTHTMAAGASSATIRNFRDDWFSAIKRMFECDNAERVAQHMLGAPFVKKVPFFVNERRQRCLRLDRGRPPISSGSGRNPGRLCHWALQNQPLRGASKPAIVGSCFVLYPSARSWW